MRQLLIILLLSGSTGFNFCYAQGQDRISVSLKQSPLLSLIDSIESKTSFRFYYLSSWTDTIEVSIDVIHAPLDVVLAQALGNSGISYFIHNKSIILTPGITLRDKFDSLKSNPGLSSTGNPSRFRNEVPDENKPKNAVKEVGKRGKTTRGSYTVSGYVRDHRSGEALPGVVIHAQGSDIAAVTDQYGFYSILLPAGNNSLATQTLGMKPFTQKINLLGDGKLDFMLEESVTQLNELVVQSDVDVNVSSVQMGMSKIDMRSMKNVPKVLGENDVLRVATTLPGVKTIGEGASGLNVRGGHADQNLVVLNEGTIYNTSHFLGFFSVFSPDAIRSFELYKSGIPVQFGGRLSSTFDLQMRDGNNKKFSGQGGIGPITSHLTLEVPLMKDKTSLMIGGRTTYSNWVLRSIPESSLKNTRANFLDYFGRITHSPNDKNTLYFSMYRSFDKFNLSSDTLFSYSNTLASVQWRHVFNANFDGVLSLTHSRYDYNMDYESADADAFKMGFAIKESNAKWEFNHTRGKHKFTYGLQSKLYDLNPGFLEKGNESSSVKARNVDHEKGLESALFVADNIDINTRLSFYFGIRYSLFLALGPSDVNTYAAGVPKSDNSVVDTVQYATNEIVKDFHGPEYRLSLRLKVTDESAIKMSYNRTRQYIHMLSNTVSVSPTDTWKLSDPNVSPQIADQVSFGVYHDFRRNVYQLSTEIYYKWLQNILDYKTGATLLVNEKIDQSILQGNGKAYGVEVLLKKNSGKITGWLGYSYSRTFIQLKSPVPAENINHGKFFPANYDKPHEVSLVSNYKITRRYSFSVNFAYSTGRPITYPTMAYRYGNAYRINYSERNAFRIPDYIRADVGFNIEGNHRIKKLAHSYWSISIYNIIARKNPYSIYFAVEDGDIKAYKLSIFGAPIPTVTYHFKF